MVANIVMLVASMDDERCMYASSYSFAVVVGVCYRCSYHVHNSLTRDSRNGFSQCPC
jgi:hypothetical protein